MALLDVGKGSAEVRQTSVSRTFSLLPIKGILTCPQSRLGAESKRDRAAVGVDSAHMAGSQSAHQLLAPQITENKAEQQEGKGGYVG